MTALNSHAQVVAADSHEPKVHASTHQNGGSDEIDLTGLSGFGSAATLDADTDGTLAANSDAKVATQKAVKTYVGTAVTGLLDFKGATDCSANPNYPAASKGDAYVVSVAGKIGGASGASVDVGDVFVASADNAGGTQAGVGTSWFVLEHNLAGAYVVGGTDVAVADGGTGASTASAGFNALSPMTTSGDLIYGGASGAGTRLAKGSDGQVLTLASGLPSWAAASGGGSSLAVAVSRQDSGAEYTTTSGSYADIDGTNLSLTLTTANHRCKVTLSGLMQIDLTTNAINFDVLIDGTSDTGGTLAWQFRPDGALGYVTESYVFISSVLSAGSHTIKLRWKVDGSTGRLNRSACPLYYIVEELGV